MSLKYEPSSQLSISTQAEGDVLVLSLWGKVENVQNAARLVLIPDFFFFFITLKPRVE